MNNSNDLISRAAAIDALTNTNLKRNVDSVCDSDMNQTRRAAQRVIAQLPAVDAVPVVYARWRDYKDEHQCSVCKEIVCVDPHAWKDIQFYFCPNCGAKMDGERRNDDEID